MEPKVWAGSYIWILIRIHILLNNGLLYNRYLVHCYSLPLALTRGVNWEVRPSLTSPSQIYKIFANIGTFSALKDILGTPGIDNIAYFGYFHAIFTHWNGIEICGGLCEVWKLFSQSCTDVPAQLPSAMLPRQARGTCKKTVIQTPETVHFISW